MHPIPCTEAASDHHAYVEEPSSTNLALITLVILSAIVSGSAVEYTVTNNAANTPGGAKFDTEIGAQYSMQTLDAATNFIWGIFQQSNPADRKSVDSVALFIDDIDDSRIVAYTINSNEIHYSARAINAGTGDVKPGIAGVLYHEMTHVWQWNGNGQGPSGLIEGIADFVRLKAGYVPSYWAQPGQGDKWDHGYDVTARFLDYCEGLGSGSFVAELNKKMRDGYSPSFFEELLGKSVDTLWADYKASYN